MLPAVYRRGELVGDPCLTRSPEPSGEPVMRLGVPLADDYLEFLSGRCRPNAVLATAYDSKVFYSVMGKMPEDVRPAHVLGFIPPTDRWPGRWTGRCDWREERACGGRDEHGRSANVDDLGVLRLLCGG